jgi:maleylacetoacetate isomerase
MKYYGFWRSLAACRVRIGLALKGVQAEEISVNLMQGEQLKPEYLAVNTQAVVPALVLDDGSTLFESMAIIEYLDETHPEPPLLPKDPKGRARVRALAQIVACDGHPLIVPRIRTYLEKELSVDEAARTRWCQHWVMEALKFVEAPRERKGNRPLLPRRCSDASRHLHGDPGVRGPLFQLRHRTRADRDAGVQRVYEARSLRQVASPEAAGRAQ